MDVIDGKPRQTLSTGSDVQHIADGAPQDGSLKTGICKMCAPPPMPLAQLGWTCPSWAGCRLTGPLARSSGPPAFHALQVLAQQLEHSECYRRRREIYSPHMRGRRVASHKAGRKKNPLDAAGKGRLVGGAAAAPGWFRAATNFRFLSCRGTNGYRT